MSPAVGRRREFRTLQRPVHVFPLSIKQRSKSCGRSVSTVSEYGLNDRAIGDRSPAGAEGFSSILCVLTGSEDHTVSCPMGTGNRTEAKARPGRALTTHLHLVQRSRMSMSYTSSPPKRLHGVYWESFGLLSRELSISPCSKLFGN
jgi:hypothetical protein